MRKIKDAITDFAIARGYDGDTPKSIARAIDTLAGVSGGGGGGGSNVIVVPYEESVPNARITLGLTVSEIIEAMQAGKTIVLDLTESEVTNGVHYFISVFCANEAEGQYEISTSGLLGSMFYATGLDGYPSAYLGD